MAITYGAKLFESEATNQSGSSILLSAVPAGGLVCIALAGKRSGSSLNVSTITDIYGNTWDWKFYPSTYRAVGVAWCRTSVAMAIGSTIRVSWNGTPTYAWKSAHSFSGASGTPTEEATAAGTGSSASVTLDVSGSDWLTFASIMLPDDYAVTATPLNSMTSRDDNGNTTSSPWAECFSRNGTVGTTHTAGASFVASVSYAVAGVSFPAEALTAPTVTRSFAFLPGV
jgi:hypothetical protein